MGLRESDPLSQLSLPPGFRFYPTDEELMVQYLCRKIAGQEFSLQVIGDIDLYKFDPWVLPSKAMFGEKEWYFFSPRDRKYPNGSRPNRVAGSGYWKATGTDKVITTEGRKVGIKKALVFYVGKAPKGTKTNWIMHEYRLSEPPRNNRSAKLDDWVLCRIYKKNSAGAKLISGAPATENSHDSRSSSSSHYDDVLETLPEINDQFFALPRVNSLKNLQIDEKPSIQSLIAGNFDWATLAAVQSVPDLVAAGEAQAHVQQQENVNARNDNYNDIFVPSFCNVDDEIQSGLKTTRMENSGFFQHNLNGNGQLCSGSFAPFDIRYPNQYGRFGFHE